MEVIRSCISCHVCAVAEGQSSPNPYQAFKIVTHGPGVVVIDEDFLRANWPMWELGVMMAALPDDAHPQRNSPGQAARGVVPVVLMDFVAVKATYECHWTPAVIEAARSEGLPPATLADLQRLLSNQGIRQDQVRFAAPLRLRVS